LSAATPTEVPWSRWCNNPLADRQTIEMQHKLRTALKARLPEYMIPTSFVVVDSIPQTAHGKVDYAALPAPPATRWRRAAIVPAATTTEEQLIAIWESLLGVHPVGAIDDFFELGGHSMLAVRLMSEIETQFGRQIALAALFHDATVRYLATLIDAPPSAHHAATLVPLQTGGDAAPLFCIHPAGGTVFCYRALAAEFAGARAVYGLQAVGVDGRNAPHANVAEMAAHYAEAIVAAYPEGPYHLTGWSLGGTLAFEVARQLNAAGHEIGLVALLDSAAVTDQAQLKEEDFVELIAVMFPAADRVSLESLRELPADEQLAYFVGLAAQAGLAPADDLAAARHVFDVFRANVKALHEFRPLAYDGPVLLLRPRDQAQSHTLADDPTLGWQQLAGAVDVQWVSGDHAQMVHAPHVTDLAAVLERAISNHKGERGTSVP
jgi:thioesterase domain-containing protein/acyl carrier protein